MPTWPLNRPQQSGYILKPDDPVIRTSIESGPVRARRRFTQSSTLIDVNWFFNMTDFGIFETFHHDELLDGVSWFDIELMNGQGITTYSARFREIWSSSAIGGINWNVKGILEVKTRPLNA